MNKKTYIIGGTIAGVVLLLALGLIEQDQARAIIALLLGGM